jgi:hypothetical protein
MVYEVRCCLLFSTGVLLSLQPLGDKMAKAKKVRQGIVYDDSYSDETELDSDETELETRLNKIVETEEDNFLTMDWELDCKKLWKTYSTRR